MIIDENNKVDYGMLEKCFPDLYAEFIETDMTIEELEERLEDIKREIKQWTARD